MVLKYTRFECDFLRYFLCLTFGIFFVTGMSSFSSARMVNVTLPPLSATAAVEKGFEPFTSPSNLTVLKGLAPVTFTSPASAVAHSPTIEVYVTV
jgi:hypothetical protein